MKAIVTGANGLVGRAQKLYCAAQGVEVAAFDHKLLDVINAAQVNKIFEDVKPDVVFNCAAWTDVDGCEFEPERARAANAVGPEVLALACRAAGALLVTISTDFVFDGRKDGFYTQRDQPNPQSIYAQTKLEGERRAQLAWARTIVVRTGYVFGIGGKNFLSALVPRAEAGERLKAISDMYGTPTYAEDLAKRLYELAQRDLPGVYHVVNSGNGASFAQFADIALTEAGLDRAMVANVELSSLKRPAPRPINSRLRCVLSPAIGLESLPPWEDATKAFVRSLRKKATNTP